MVKTTRRERKLKMDRWRLNERVVLRVNGAGQMLLPCPRRAWNEQRHDHPEAAAEVGDAKLLATFVPSRPEGMRCSRGDAPRRGPVSWHAIPSCPVRSLGRRSACGEVPSVGSGSRPAGSAARRGQRRCEQGKLERELPQDCQSRDEPQRLRGPDKRCEALPVTKMLDYLRCAGQAE